LPGVQVINAGVSGYGTDQEYLYYLDEGHRFRPDLVLLVFYPNDFSENLLVYDNGLISPNFEWADPGGLELSNVPVPLVPGWGPAWIAGNSLREWLYLHSAVYARWNRVLVERLPKLPYQYNVYPSVEHMERSSVSLRILQALNRRVQADGARLVVVTVPYAEMVWNLEWSKLQREQGLEERERFEAYQDYFTPLKQDGVLLLHTFRRLRKELRADRDPYSHAHYHWNASGHRVVADLLSDYIQRHGLLERSR
jgi:hypothetical protein